MTTTTRRMATWRRAAGMILVLLAVPFVATAQTPSADTLPIRRYGLFIGANDGGPERTRLLYAESDCRAMVRVLEEVGGLAEQDAVILVDPDAPQIVGTLSEMGERIQRERPQARRVEFVLYYSGHSDDEALMLGGSRLGYAQLRDAVRDLGADISIAILDSCASGAFIRLKGGQRKPAFLVDESSAVQGQVYLTSSSEDEASQESDTLGGSFFTHALISALRGAADFSLDRKVTLHEAYQFASQETLARTENTQGGPQHPSWYINLNGTGDLVLTDLRSTTAGLTMAEDVVGRIYIRDERGKLVVEVRKSAGTPLTLALPPGPYAVVMSTDARSFEARITLREGTWETLAKSDLRDAPRAATRSRGDGKTAADASTESTESTEWRSADADRARQLVREAAAEDKDGEEDDGEDDRAGVGEFFGELGREVGELIRRGVDQVLARDRAKARSEKDEGGDTEWSRSGSSQSSGDIVPFSLGIVPGISFPRAAESRKLVSLNLLIGVSYGIAGFEASSIMNITSHDVWGGQVAGVGNIVSGELRGYQGAGVFNTVGGRSIGIQSAGVFNAAKSGGSLGQVAGVFNTAEGAMFGAQVAGVFNQAAGIRGAQVAGVFNSSGGDVQGVQVAGVFNVAAGLRGGQIGVVNVATEGRGVQLGVVNVAKNMTGVQIGVVNVASSLGGIPIGLVNIVSDGLLLLTVGYDDRGFATAEIASGKGFYTLLAVGAQIDEAMAPGAVTAAAGIGVHVPVGPFFLEGELTARNAFGVPPVGTFVSTDLVPFPSATVRAGLMLFNRVGAFVGCAVDGLVAYPWVPVNTVAHTGLSYTADIGGVGVSVYPRFFAGVAIGRQTGRR